MRLISGGSEGPSNQTEVKHEDMRNTRYIISVVLMGIRSCLGIGEAISSSTDTYALCNQHLLCCKYDRARL